MGVGAISAEDTLALLNFSIVHVQHEENVSP